MSTATGAAHLPMPIVVGYPRSGTTLMRLMLDAHPALSIPPETGFLIDVAKLPDDTSAGEIWQLITQHQSWPAMKLDADELRTRLEALTDPSPADAVRAFYSLYSARFEKTRCGDKTPYYAGKMTEIQRLLPEARFVHMIRDGRDTAVSIRGLWFSPGDDPITLATSWVRRITRARAQRDHLSGYLEIRYEDLVTEPERELRRVCELIDLEFDPKMLEHDRTAPERLAEMTPEGMMDHDEEEIPEVIRYARRTVDPSRVGRWRNELTSSEAATYEAFAGPMLVANGYGLSASRAARSLASVRARLAAFWSKVGPKETLGLAAAMALAAAVVVVYVLWTKPNGLAGDQVTYHEMGVFFTQGNPWWSHAPYGVPHASAWKAPVYPAWVGFWYEILGHSPTRLAIVQGLLMAPLTVFFAWLLARRLFGPMVALAAAFLVALLPFSWEYIALLYPEALAIPLALAAMVIFLGRNPTPRIAVATGAIVGVCMLVRPNSFFLFAGALASWWVLAGGRRATKMIVISVGVAALMIAPWTIRNTLTVGGFVPISIQDAAVYGTFNDTAANDDRFPYAWRARIEPMPEVFQEPDTSDAELRSRLIAEATTYIREHPESLLEAYFWNGVVRFLDLQRPANVEHAIEGSGRTRLTGFVGFGLHWLLIPPALLALWRLRTRRELLYGLLAITFVLSLTVIPDSTTRYRAPLEPVIAILACSALIPALARGGRALPSGGRPRLRPSRR